MWYLLITVYLVIAVIVSAIFIRKEGPGLREFPTSEDTITDALTGALALCVGIMWPLALVIVGGGGLLAFYTKVVLSFQSNKQKGDS